MRILNSYIFRALCALLVGFLLVSNPERMTTLLVQVIGGLFTVSGITAIINYFVGRHQQRRLARQMQEQGLDAPQTAFFAPIFPVVGIGSLAFGVFLLLMPGQFINIFMYVLGVLLILAGGTQCISLIRYRRVAPLNWSVFIFPVLILCMGIYVVCQPQTGASIPFIILGIGCICYGAAEFFLGLRLHRFMKRVAKAKAKALEAAQAVADAEDATFEEVTEDTDADNGE